MLLKITEPTLSAKQNGERSCIGHVKNDEASPKSYVMTVYSLLNLVVEEIPLALAKFIFMFHDHFVTLLLH